MTVGDLIKEKDYDYISWRATVPEGIDIGEGDIFVGCSKSENGKLISLDGDCYSEKTEILSYEEWEDQEEGIKNGLTVVYKGLYRV